MSAELARLAQLRLDLWMDRFLPYQIETAIAHIRQTKSKGQAQPAQVFVLVDQSVNPRELASDDIPFRYLTPGSPEIDQIHKFVLERLPTDIRVSEQGIGPIEKSYNGWDSLIVNPEALFFTLELV